MRGNHFPWADLTGPGKHWTVQTMRAGTHHTAAAAPQEDSVIGTHKYHLCHLNITPALQVFLKESGSYIPMVMLKRHLVLLQLPTKELLHQNYLPLSQRKIENERRETDCDWLGNLSRIIWQAYKALSTAFNKIINIYIALFEHSKHWTGIISISFPTSL